MPKAKAKAKHAPKAVPKQKAKLDRYAYLPTDLQRAAVFMDRADFLRKLQEGQHDREYRHVATQGPPPLSADKALQEKIAALNAEIADLKRASTAPPTPSTGVPGSRATGAGSFAPGSRVTIGGSMGSRTPFLPMDDDRRAREEGNRGWRDDH